jgi:ribonucleoside-diphosphate reductase alpha chain
MKLERSEVLGGKTYKIKPPIIDDAVYITINDAEVDGQIRPVEVFINSKNMENFPWISFTTRALSAAFRQDGPFPMYIVNEMFQTHDPKGGYIIPKSKGARAHSIVGHIGWVIKNHCEALGITK